MTDSETRVLARTAAVLLVVSAVRYGWEVRRSPPVLPVPHDDGPALLEKSRTLGEENEARRKPLAPDEKIDPNRAAEVELDRLPGLGPAAAKAIVSARERNGDFVSLEALLDVPGIGDATLKRIRPYLALSPARAGAPRRLPAGGPAPRPTSAPLDLNRATAPDLEKLPGVGPALARRILEARAAKGGAFRSPDDLLSVRGIGPATLARLRPLIRVGGGGPD